MASDHDPGTNRLPPLNREAERSVLGSMLRDNAVISDLIQVLRTADFYEDGHQKIYDAIVALNDKGGQPVDIVLLAEELQRRGQIEDVGGYPAIADLWDAAPTAANAEYYAKIVREKALVRGLIHASTEILRDAYDQVMPADQLIEGAERKILDVAEKGITGNTWTLEQAIEETYDRIDKRQTGAELQFSGLRTHFADLDEITAGLQRSEMIIIAARPSVGKTAFSLNLVRNIILDEKEPVFFVSLEQSRLELAERMLCSQARVDSHRLRKGNLTGEDMDKLIEAGGVLRNAKLFIDDSPTQSMLRISANARRLRHRQGIKLVVIDYLQLIEPDNRRDPRQEQVAQISRRIKAVARELEIPVVALAQVNRASEDRQDHRPRLSDLRESGCLAGDTLVTMADTGARVPMRDLVGKSGFEVWALDEVSMKLKPAEVSHAFRTGRKPVYALETRLGRRIRATSNHQFRTFAGWRRLDELKVKDLIALPRVLPSGASPATLTRPQAALIGHLLGDGCTLPRHSLQYATREADLGQIVMELAAALRECCDWIAARTANTNRDIIPKAVWRTHAVPAMKRNGVTMRQMQSALGASFCGTTLYKQNVSRERLRRVATAVGGEETLQTLAASDVYWDQIRSIRPAGEEDVFDLTVPGPANFVANDVIVHNSIEQDADTVLMLHRPDRYEPGQNESVLEVIVAKQRNGPTGEITLAYIKQHMRYEDFQPGTPFDRS